tara:strand:+ start:12127 stop:12300 length:174 start_codon:yes stop_codon:yes gene_type:complete
MLDKSLVNKACFLHGLVKRAGLSWGIAGITGLNKISVWPPKYLDGMAFFEKFSPEVP